MLARLIFIFVNVFVLLILIDSLAVLLKSEPIIFNKFFSNKPKMFTLIYLLSSTTVISESIIGTTRNVRLGLFVVFLIVPATTFLVYKTLKKNQNKL